MDFRDVLYTRQSIRDYDSREVSDEVLNRVLESALQSPSNCNVQPYRIAVAKGDLRKTIRDELSQKYALACKVKRMPLPLKIYKGLTSNVMPDGDYDPDVKYPKELSERKFECGMGLYETLGIERHDYAAREAQMGRNFEFFDAPVAMFIFMNDKLGHYSALDTGIFLQSLMLSAHAEGLGTCAQGALAIWASPVRKHFEIEEDYKMICGLSLGYPTSHHVNTYQPAKRSVEELCFKTVK
jgi:nitroreductase